MLDMMFKQKEGNFKNFIEKSDCKRGRPTDFIEDAIKRESKHCRESNENKQEKTDAQKRSMSVL